MKMSEEEKMDKFRVADARSMLPPDDRVTVISTARLERVYLGFYKFEVLKRTMLAELEKLKHALAILAIQQMIELIKDEQEIEAKAKKLKTEMEGK